MIDMAFLLDYINKYLIFRHPDLCFSRGREGSTQRASASVPDVEEDLSIF